MPSKKIIITGGAGMIGSNLVKRLVSLGNDVHVVDNLWRGRLENLCDAKGKSVIDVDTHFHRLDLSIPDQLDPLLENVDIVYHLADIVAGIDFVFNKNLLINTNVIASVRRSKVGGFIYVGTACSFPRQLQSGVDARPLVEEDQIPANPESAYGWSKLMGEYEAFLMEKECGIPVCVLSLHNVYGTPTEFSEKTSQVIPALIRKAVRYPLEPFIVWGSGSQGRAFVHVNDVVEALVLAADKGLGKGLIQIGVDRCTSIREIAETVSRISGKDIDIRYDTERPEGDRGRCCNASKARRILGWEPKVGIEAGLRDLYEWIESRMNSH
jgi:GDP-D-mannose 3', 5'-epimerase